MSRLTFAILLVVAAVDASAQARSPTQADLNTARQKATGWLLVNRDYAGWRYSPANQIRPDNVGELRPVCHVDLGSTPPFQSNPIVHDSVMYITTSVSTIAVDARDCRELWKYERQPRDSTNYPQQRGVAIKDGLVVRGTSDGYLLALSAIDGKLVWEQKIADALAGESITMPIVPYRNMVFAGPAGSEVGVRGWIAAFDLETGNELWRFNTVPRPGEPGDSTWGDPQAIRGGGVWSSVSLDPARGELYVPVGSVAPPFNDDARPGSNLYTSSMVVLDARTGKLLWYRQQVPHDVRNWDVTHVSPIYETSVRGTPRRLVAIAGKSGLLDVYDRSTRRLVFSTPVTRRSGLDSTGAPNAGRVCPGPFGGVVYNGPAYSPRTNIIYVPAVDWCATVAKSAPSPVVPRQFNWGGTFEFDSVTRARGWLTAVDGATGVVKWRYMSSRPMIAAVAVTSTHVLLTGEIGGDLVALDARDGRPLSRHPLGAPLGGGLVTYMASGRQYVAAVSGTIGEFWGVPPAPSRVTILSLGGR